MIDVVAAISAGTQALNALKAVREIDKSLDEASWKAKVAELMGNVADMKMALVDAQDEMRRLEQENQKLLEQLKYRAQKTVTQRGWIYEVLEDGRPRRLPLCPYCLSKGASVQLMDSTKSFRECRCPHCKTDYETREVGYQHPPAVAPTA